MFQGTKLPLTVWFQAMHLLTQGKHSVSALELKRQLGVHYETAWVIKQKLMQVMPERETETVLSGRIEVDDAYMGSARHEKKIGPGVLQARQPSSWPSRPIRRSLPESFG
jgi:hypothetical protein